MQPSRQVIIDYEDTTDAHHNFILLHKWTITQLAQRYSIHDAEQETRWTCSKNKVI